MQDGRPESHLSTQRARLLLFSDPASGNLEAFLHFFLSAATALSFTPSFADFDDGRVVNMGIWSLVCILFLVAVGSSRADDNFVHNPRFDRNAAPQQVQESVCYSYYTTYYTAVTPILPQEPHTLRR